MGLCGYEAAVLRRITTGNTLGVSGAALQCAVEVLTKQGYLKDGKPTAKADAELRLGMAVDLLSSRRKDDNISN